MSAKSWSTTPLSNIQKATLSIAARAAFDIQDRCGLVTEKFDEWRHLQTRIACGIESLRRCNQNHYLSILGHFQRLAGKESAAQSTWSKTGRVAGSTEASDTAENRETIRWKLDQLIATSGGLISDSYVAAIIRDKYQGRALTSLTSNDLQRLFFTIRTRLTALRKKS